MRVGPRSYIGKNSVGSHRYFGSPDMDIINKDFESLPEKVRRDYTSRKQILWESDDCSKSDLSHKEIEYIRKHKANNPGIGYNRWPKFKEKPQQQTRHPLKGTENRGRQW
jgi:hypothetical protein